jgi:hypothetical protein
MAYKRLKRWLTGRHLKKRNSIGIFKAALSIILTLALISLAWKLIDMLETWINNDWYVVGMWVGVIVIIALIGYFLLRTKKYNPARKAKSFWG